MLKSIIAIACPLLLGGCITDRTTDTPRSATEQLLLSGAADQAAAAITQTMPSGSKLFLDSSDFDATDGKYAVGAIQDALLRRNNKLVDNRVEADEVVEIRSGALATNDHELLIGIPSFPIPIPLAGTVTTPKIALYDRTTQLGVAKFAATATNAKTGALVASSTPQYKFAHTTKHIVLLFFGWHSDDLIPPSQRDPDFE